MEVHIKIKCHIETGNGDELARTLDQMFLDAQEDWQARLACDFGADLHIGSFECVYEKED